MTRLKPSIHKQVFLNKRPSKLDEATSDIEFELDFGTDGKDRILRSLPTVPKCNSRLQSAVETLTDRLEKCTLGQSTCQSQRNGQGRDRGCRPVDMTCVQCFKCHEYGNYQYQCLLNEQQPVPKMWRLTAVTVDHPSNHSNRNSGPALQVSCMLGNTKARVLIDSGAAVSVIWHPTRTS